MSVKSPYRYDFVGSFLRPEKLKKAKQDFHDKKITEPELNKIIEESITDVVTKQKKLGYHIITDGEFRRTYWHLDFMWGLGGIGHAEEPTRVVVNGTECFFHDTYVIGKITSKPHPFVEYYKFLKQFEDQNTVAKYTIPSPSQTMRQMTSNKNYEQTKKFYPNMEDFIQDLAKAYQDIIKQFYDAGCRNLQIDDCTWGTLVRDPEYFKEKGIIFLGIEGGIEEVKKTYLRLNNLALKGKPKDMMINSHICRGNYNSCYFSKGPYDGVADYVFAKENVNGLLLEFDDERSGGFEPLAKVSPDKKIVLGLITTKTPKLEDKKRIIERIKEAAKFIPLDRLYISPQCGFASCEIGNKLTEEEQWAKLRLVKEIAEEVWGKE